MIKLDKQTNRIETIYSLKPVATMMTANKYLFPITYRSC